MKKLLGLFRSRPRPPAITPERYEALVRMVIEQNEKLAEVVLLNAYNTSSIEMLMPAASISKTRLGRCELTIDQMEARVRDAEIYAKTLRAEFGIE